MSRPSYIRAGLAAVLVGLLSVSASAQTAVTDPRIVEFDPSPDHNAMRTDGQPHVTRYDLEMYVIGATLPTRVVNLGKPAPQTDGKIRVDFTSLLSPWPAPGTTYEARVVAVGPGGDGRSTQSNTFAFSAQCSAAISPTSVSVGGAASTGSVAVTAIAGCSWTAASSASWLTLTAGATGTGSGTVSYSVAANTTASSRTATITIAGLTFTLTQAAGCSYTITPTATSVAAAATTGSLSVTTTASCAWTASSAVSWITITSGATGTGSGPVNYSVAANTSGAPRTGTLTAAGRTFTVTQDGACTFTLSPVSASLGSAASTGTVSVASPSGCAWTATSSASWLTITAGSSGSGNGQVAYSATANTGTTSRSATITVAGQVFTVTQAGQSCTFAISPVSASVPAAATSSSVNVSTTAGCTWTATSAVSWITITSGASGTGNGTVAFNVAANSSLSPRTGTLTIGGQTFTVTQAAVVCSATIAPVTASVGSGGAQGTVAVTLPSVCTWTAASNASWITITAGSSGTGNGSVNYTVAANTATSTRTGTLTIAGQTFTVTQAGVPCSYTANPTAAPAVAGAGSGTVNVTTAAGCAWTASSSAPWLTITSGAAGSGSGSVSYAFVANPTTQSRTGVLTVAGQAVTITQAAGCGYSISPTSASLTGSAGTGTVNVTAGSGCAWTSQSPVSWITFSTPTAGTGNGSVGYVVAANADINSRSATITVAGQPFVITQAGASCDAALVPATQNVSAAGGNASVDITVPAGCAWSAVSGVSWITVLTGASGSGNGTITYRVDANPAGTSRTGTIAIGGRLLTVTQAGAPCTAVLSSTSDTIQATGGTRVVSVTIPSGCSWSASSNASWITVTSGAGPNTSGNGAVTFAVAANASTTARTGTLTIAGQTFTVSQAGAACTFTVAPTTAPAVSTAGTGSVTVTTLAGCAWTASSSASWLTITAGASGTDSGTVSYSFTANPTTLSRAGVLTVAGQAVTITQAAGCGYAVSPTTASLTASAGTGLVSVSAGLGCAWTATSPETWVTFSTSTTGAGNGTVGYVVAANTNSSSRSATLTIAGQPFVITQAGAACDATLSPTTQNIAAAGADSSVDITVPGGCGWSAVPGVSWITVLTGATGSGNGTITYRVSANPSGTSRTGTIAIGGRLLTVTQTGAPCTAVLSPTSDSIQAAGGTRVVSVTIPSGCSWSAVSNASWITVTAGAGPNTSGNGAVTFSVAANTSTTPRTGTLTIAGQTFTASQAGVACTQTVNPTAASAVASAGNGRVNVVSPSGCQWTASSSVTWMTITAGLTGSGSGDVDYAFTANPTTQARQGVLTVAGQAVTITQAAGCGYGISPATASVTSMQSPGTITVTAGGGCAWAAQSPVTWITFSTSTTGTGNGSVGYVVAANADSNSRSATITVAGQPFVITQAGASCDATLTPATQSIAAAGGNSSVDIAVPGGCAWSAVSGVPWITVLTGASGSGSGTVTYNVEPNAAGVSRTGTIAIGGRLATVTQAAVPCTATLSSTNESVESDGDTRVVSVVIPSGCVWSATSNTSWITVTSGGGPNSSGSAGVTFAVAANTGVGARTGTLTVASQTVTVQQAGTCLITLSPTGVSTPSDATTGSFSVSTGGSCTWSASSSDSWLTITSGANGTGNGSVSYAVAANSGATPRTATLTVGSRTFTVTQDAPVCNSVVSPTSISLSDMATSRTVQVSIASGCGWTASSSVSWMAITSGGTGVGAGSVTYSVAANTSSASRTGTLTVAGRTVTVTQTGVTCGVTFSPTSITLTGAGTTDTIAVNASSTCAWTATTSVPWITITSGASGSGNGTILYSVAPNSTGFTRVGTIMIGSLGFSVTQAGNTCTAVLSSSSVSVGPAPSTVPVNVSVSADCTWTSSSAASWITVASGDAGTGPGTVVLSVAQNTSTAGRTGTVSIAGRAFSVTQSGACDYTVSPIGLTVSGSSSSGFVWVTAGAGCAWTVQSHASWVTANSAGGSGAGIVSLTVAANPSTTPRAATVTIAGESVTVTQAGAACTLTVSPVSLNVGGGSHSIAVTAPNGCTWTAATTAQWMSFPNGASGNGTGTLVVQLEPNPGPYSRSGVISIGAWRIFVTERVSVPPNVPTGLIVR